MLHGTTLMMPDRVSLKSSVTGSPVLLSAGRSEVAAGWHCRGISTILPLSEGCKTGSFPHRISNIPNYIIISLQNVKKKLKKPEDISSQLPTPPLPASIPAFTA